VANSDARGTAFSTSLTGIFAAGIAFIFPPAEESRAVRALGLT
jgi:hypothetical protein